MATSMHHDLDSPEVVGNLVLQGATVVILDVPRGTEFGIDLNVWHTDSNFKGFKMIPPGIHFIYFSACNKDGQSAPRTGFIHNFKSREVVIKKYDRLLEDIVDVEIDSLSESQRRKNLKEFDKYLGAYPLDIWKEWISLTDHLSNDVLEKLLPSNRKICSVTEFMPNPSGDQKEVREPPRIIRNIEDLLPKMIQKPETEIKFTKLPQHSYPEGCSAAEISKHSLDQSYKLEQVLERYTKSVDILGELQMAFICFVVGQVYDAFEQWQKLFQLLCSCDDALVIHHDLYFGFITNIYFQLNHLPKDIFVDIVSKTNFLTTNLQGFFCNLENSSAPKELIHKGKRFQIFLTKKFKWDFDSEPDDCAPVIVDEMNV